MSPLDRASQALTSALRHHGVEMHPDDIRGLAYDAIAAIKESTAQMILNGRVAVGELEAHPHHMLAAYRAMINTALNEKSQPAAEPERSHRPGGFQTKVVR